MKKFLTALGFLTIIPVKYKLKGEEEFALSMVYFPLVGLLIGMILVFINFILNLIFPKIVVDALILIILIILTGSLHIDGFADTCDGFFSFKSKDEILNIMKDSRMGMFGLVGVISLILLKFASLYSLNYEAKSYALLLAPVFGRFAMVFITRIGKFAREGLGELYVKYINKKIVLITSLITVIITIIVSLLLHRWKGIFIIPVVLLVCIAIKNYSKKKIDGITGDVIGAAGELTETISFLFFAIK